MTKTKEEFQDKNLKEISSLNKNQISIREGELISQYMKGSNNNNGGHNAQNNKNTVYMRKTQQNSEVQPAVIKKQQQQQQSQQQVYTFVRKEKNQQEDELQVTNAKQNVQQSKRKSINQNSQKANNNNNNNSNNHNNSNKQISESSESVSKIFNTIVILGCSDINSSNDTSNIIPCSEIYNCETQQQQQQKQIYLVMIGVNEVVSIIEHCEFQVRDQDDIIQSLQVITKKIKINQNNSQKNDRTLMITQTNNESDVSFMKEIRQYLDSNYSELLQDQEIISLQKLLQPEEVSNEQISKVEIDKLQNDLMKSIDVSNQEIILNETKLLNYFWNKDIKQIVQIIMILSKQRIFLKNSNSNDPCQYYAAIQDFISQNKNKQSKSKQQKQADKQSSLKNSTKQKQEIKEKDVIKQQEDDQFEIRSQSTQQQESDPLNQMIDTTFGNQNFIAENKEGQELPQKLSNEQDNESFSSKQFSEQQQQQSEQIKTEMVIAKSNEQPQFDSDQNHHSQSALVDQEIKCIEPLNINNEIDNNNQQGDSQMDEKQNIINSMDDKIFEQSLLINKVDNIDLCLSEQDNDSISNSNDEEDDQEQEQIEEQIKNNMEQKLKLLFEGMRETKKEKKKALKQQKMFQESLKAVNQEVKDVQEQMKQLQQLNQQQQTQIQQDKIKEIEQSAQMKELQIDNRQYADKIEQLKNEQKQDQIQIQNLSSQLQTQQEQIESLSSDNQYKDNYIQQILIYINEIEQHNQIIEQQISAFDEQKHESESLIDTLQQSQQQLQSQLTACQSDYQQQLLVKDKQIAIKEKEINELNIKIEQQSTQTVQFHKLIEQQKVTLSQQEIKLKDQDKYQQQLSIDHSKNKLEYENQIHTLQQQVSSLQSKLTESNSIVEEQKGQLEERNDELKNSMIKYQQLEQKIDEESLIKGQQQLISSQALQKASQILIDCSQALLNQNPLSISSIIINQDSVVHDIFTAPLSNYSSYDKQNQQKQNISDIQEIISSMQPVNKFLSNLESSSNQQMQKQSILMTEQQEQQQSFNQSGGDTQQETNNKQSEQQPSSLIELYPKKEIKHQKDDQIVSQQSQIESQKDNNSAHLQQEILTYEQEEEEEEFTTKVSNSFTKQEKQDQMDSVEDQIGMQGYHSGTEQRQYKQLSIPQKDANNCIQDNKGTSNEENQTFKQQNEHSPSHHEDKQQFSFSSLASASSSESNSEKNESSSKKKKMNSESNPFSFELKKKDVSEVTDKKEEQSNDQSNPEKAAVKQIEDIFNQNQNPFMIYYQNQYLSPINKKAPSQKQAQQAQRLSNLGSQNQDAQSKEFSQSSLDMSTTKELNNNHHQIQTNDESKSDTNISKAKKANEMNMKYSLVPYVEEEKLDNCDSQEFINIYDLIRPSKKVSAKEMGKLLLKNQADVTQALKLNESSSNIQMLVPLCFNRGTDGNDSIEISVSVINYSNQQIIDELSLVTSSSAQNNNNNQNGNQPYSMNTSNHFSYSPFTRYDQQPQQYQSQQQQQSQTVYIPKKNMNKNVTQIYTPTHQNHFNNGSANRNCSAPNYKARQNGFSSGSRNASANSKYSFEAGFVKLCNFLKQFLDNYSCVLILEGQNNSELMQECFIKNRILPCPKRLSIFYSCMFLDDAFPMSFSGLGTPITTASQAAQVLNIQKKLKKGQGNDSKLLGNVLQALLQKGVSLEAKQLKPILQDPLQKKAKELVEQIISAFEQYDNLFIINFQQGSQQQDRDRLERSKFNMVILKKTQESKFAEVNDKFGLSYDFYKCGVNRFQQLFFNYLYKADVQIDSGIFIFYEPSLPLSLQFLSIINIKGINNTPDNFKKHQYKQNHNNNSQGQSFHPHHQQYIVISEQLNNFMQSNSQSVLERLKPSFDFHQILFSLNSMQVSSPQAEMSPRD